MGYLSVGFYDVLNTSGHKRKIIDQRIGDIYGFVVVAVVVLFVLFFSVFFLLYLFQMKQTTKELCYHMGIYISKPTTKSNILHVYFF